MIVRPFGPSAVPVLLACVLSAAACGGRVAEEVESEAVVSVKTEPAGLGSIRSVVHTTGTVNPGPGAELAVVAPEAARILEIPPAVGDRVRAGDLLVRFEIPNLTAEVQKQQAEVARAEALVTNAVAAQTRASGLFERGVAARKEVEEATNAVAEAQAAQAQARAALAAAQTLAGRATVRATFDGVVVKRSHNPGDLVEAAGSDPVLRVIDPRRLEVTAMVPITEASHVEVGAAGRLTALSDGGDENQLQVISRPAAVDVGTAAVPVRLKFAVSTSIPSGTPVEVHIDAEQHSNAVLVPAAAIVREGDETAIFVADGDKAQRRTVQIGLTDGIHTEIVSGVSAGEHVIVDGQAGLPDGATITTADEAGTPKTPETDGGKGDTR